MKTLIFDTTLTGHHLEYSHHLYMGAGKDSDNEYVIALPREQWKEMSGKLQWPSFENISFYFLDDYLCHKAEQGNMLSRCWTVSRFATNIIKETQSNRIVLISLAQYIPFLPLMMPKDTDLRGIIYKIYLRTNNKSRLWHLIDKLRYSLMAHSQHVDKVFILNDPKSSHQLCNIYHSEKFVTLPDPVPVVDKSKLHDVRDELGIPKDNKIFLHFGSMDKRKGTLEILKALLLLPQNALAKFSFIFAGKINGGIKNEFNMLVEKVQDMGIDIHVSDEFCSFETLNDLCYTCDCILIPYILTDLSSGVIGYAAVHGKPVIGPGSGLIGDLIKHNNLGVTLDQISPLSIQSAILGNLPRVANLDYLENNNITKFQQLILG